MADSLTGRRKRSLADIKSRVDAGLHISGDEAISLIQARHEATGEAETTHFYNVTPLNSEEGMSKVAASRLSRLQRAKQRNGEWNGADSYIYGPHK
jgi:hypothetical protein